MSKIIPSDRFRGALLGKVAGTLIKVGVPLSKKGCYYNRKGLRYRYEWFY